jgi:branched-chain amino acid transport system permease protein
VGAFIMVAVQEIFRTGGFGALHAIDKATGWPFVAVLAKYISEAHVLSFGVLVIIVILFLPNGIVGDWQLIKNKFVKSHKPLG